MSTLIFLRRSIVAVLLGILVSSSVTSPSYSVIAAPTNLLLSANATSSERLVLSWDEVVNADSYQAEIYLESDADAVANGETKTPVQIIPTAQTTVVFTGLVNGIRYKARVFSRVLSQDSSETTDYPSEFSQAALPYGEPSAPISVTVSQSGVNTLTVSWETPLSLNGSPLIKYIISTTCEPDCTAQPDTFTETNNKTFSSLNTAKTYKFTVKAQNARGSTPAPETAGVKPFGSIAPPTNLTVTPGDAKLTASWTEVPVINAPDVTYSVQVVRASDMSEVIPAFEVDALNATLSSGIQNGVSYVVKVSAKVGAISGTQKISSAVTPAAPVINPPAAPVINPPAVNSAPTQTTSGASSASSVSVPLAIKPKSNISASTLASNFNLAIPAKSKVTLKVSKSSSKVCKASGTKIIGSKTGTCVVTIKVQPPKPKPFTLSSTMSVQSGVISSVQIFENLGLPFNSKTKISITVQKNSKKVCSVSRSQIKVKAPGTCEYKVRIQLPQPNLSSATGTLNIN